MKYIVETYNGYETMVEVNTSFAAWSANDTAILVAPTVDEMKKLIDLRTNKTETGCK